MLAFIVTVLLSATVSLGILLQIATVARLGGRIARARRSRRSSTAPVPLRPGTGAPAPTLRFRRRCRNYRLALQSRASA